jgi:hypothetical protein
MHVECQSGTRRVTRLLSWSLVFYYVRSANAIQISGGFRLVLPKQYQREREREREREARAIHPPPPTDPLNTQTYP